MKKILLLIITFTLFISNINAITKEDLTLTPVFEKGTFKITYQSDENGIIIGNNSLEITYPNTLPLIETKTLFDNYEFEYWTSNTDVI